MSWEPLVGAEEASGPTCSLHRWGTEAQSGGTSLRSLLPRMSPALRPRPGSPCPAPSVLLLPPQLTEVFFLLGEAVLLSVGSLGPRVGRTPALHPGVCGEHSGCELEWGKHHIFIFTHFWLKLSILFIMVTRYRPQKCHRPR